MKTCTNCGLSVKRKPNRFCSNFCQQDYRYKNYIDNWLQEKVVGYGKDGVISNHIKKYLISIRGEKCSQCGWSKRHSITGKVPIELDHIDGNYKNGKIENLRLLCPNCHALTPTFKNLNHGKGRKFRGKGAGVTSMVEAPLCKRNVAGSSPVSSSNFL